MTNLITKYLNRLAWIRSGLFALTITICQFAVAAPTISKPVSLPDNLFTLEKVSSRHQSIWSLAFISENTIVYTERTGRIGTLNIQTGKWNYLTFRPRIEVIGQGGLLDVKPSPDFNNDRHLYFTYSKPTSSGPATTLSRAVFKNNQLQQWEDLLITRSASNSGQHFGSRIAFDKQGHIFFSVGDRGKRENAQDLTNHAGSIIRLHLDGRIPQDNPFNSIKGAAPGIWSYGHRNPQGLAYDDTTGQLWAIEHGPRGGDEINLIKRGGNYGWPIASHGREYWAPLAVGESTSVPGMIDPVQVYIPSIAPSSLLLYKGRKFEKFNNRLVAGALKLQHLNLIELNEDQQAIGEWRILESLQQRVRALTQGPDDLIYFATDSGNIYRLRSTQ
ncbi:MAG: glucose/arabinose dehydrogenase [Gammaproteobacteria bacterium]|jgi:glucose/arabinose dehydrogenase